MIFYKDLESMESAVEKDKEREDELKMFAGSIATMEDLYEKCRSIKSDVETLRELEMIGDDITEAMQILENHFIYLIQEGKRKFDLSPEQIEIIKNKTFGTKSRKIK